LAVTFIPSLSSLRLSATLLLAGQLLYIAITQFHTGGNANDHHAIFAAYAGSELWTAVHAGQFAAMAILLAGLFALADSLGVPDHLTWLSSRCGAAMAVVALALYGVLQAVDGVANKQADMAWLHAPEAETTARFASAEAIRWIEWGLRSYHDYALGVALILVGLAATRTSWAPRLLGYLIGLSGLIYLVQGWVAGVEGFSQTQSMAIVLAWVVSLLWMIWLAVVARRLPAL
jgi:hypothetical protein